MRLIFSVSAGNTSASPRDMDHMHPLNDILTYFFRDAAAFFADMASSIGSRLWVVKFLSLGLSALFLWGTIYSRKKSGEREFRANMWHLRLGGKHYAQRKLRRQWAGVLKKIRNREDRAEWASALSGAERVTQEALRIRGYLAITDAERTALAENDPAFKFADAFRDAQAIYRRAKGTEDPFTHEEAMRGLKAYKAVIQGLDVMGGSF